MQRKPCKEQAENRKRIQGKEHSDVDIEGSKACSYISDDCSKVCKRASAAMSMTFTKQLVEENMQDMKRKASNQT